MLRLNVCSKMFKNKPNSLTNEFVMTCHKHISTGSTPLNGSLKFHVTITIQARRKFINWGHRSVTPILYSHRKSMFRLRWKRNLDRSIFYRQFACNRNPFRGIFESAPSKCHARLLSGEWKIEDSYLSASWRLKY